MDCMESVWKMKVNPGYYKIIITYGDSEISAKYDMMLNEKPFAGEFLVEN